MVSSKPLFFSKLTLNIAAPRVQADLENRYGLHLAVVSGFTGRYADQNRVLWRLESNAQGRHLLVQSQKAPDWSSLIERPGYLAAAPEMKQMPIQFANGQELKFMLDGNPVYRNSADGKLSILATDPERFDWLQGRLAQCGMEMLSADIVTANVQRLRRDKPGDAPMTITLAACRFDGWLRVVEPDKALNGVRNGIGRGKAFGMGLLSLARA